MTGGFPRLTLPELGLRSSEPRLTSPEHGLGSSEHGLASLEHSLGSSKHGLASSEHDLTSSEHGLPSPKHCLASGEHLLASGEHGLESGEHGLPFPWARDCKERTNRSQISVCWKIIRPIPSHNIPKTRRRFLLLPGGEGRDEGGRSNYFCF